MCGIYLSDNFHDFDVLALANAYRGGDTSSITFFYEDGDIDVQKYDTGYDSSQMINSYLKPIKCIVGHTQAATTKDSVAHPVIVNEKLLWHNGVIKSDCIRMMQEKTGLTTSFDTELMLNMIDQYGLESLNDIDGGFSCFYYNGTSLHIFRNTQSPLFFGNDRELGFGISSTKTKMTNINIKPDVASILDEVGDLKSVFKFKTKNNPFFFG